MSYKKILTIQDISCVGQCSLTVALPIISACGIETCVLPSAVLSTHTAGFSGYTFRDLTEDMLSSYLYSADVPDPELIIRPSGEKRISNFLLWQSAYSEFVFMNVLWPDFAPEHLDEAIEEYHRRNRRFGGV